MRAMYLFHSMKHELCIFFLPSLPVTKFSLQLDGGYRKFFSFFPPELMYRQQRTHGVSTEENNPGNQFWWQASNKSFFPSFFSPFFSFKKVRRYLSHILSLVTFFESNDQTMTEDISYVNSRFIKEKSFISSKSWLSCNDCACSVPENESLKFNLSACLHYHLIVFI